MTRTEAQIKAYVHALSESAKEYRSRGQKPQEDRCHEAINRQLDELSSRSR